MSNMRKAPRYKINDENIQFVHRNLLEAEYMDLRERADDRVGLAFLIGLGLGAAVMLLAAWWLL